MEYTLIRKRKNKRMYVRIKQGAVVVTAPYFLPTYKIERFLKENRRWIEAQLNTVEPDVVTLFERSYKVVYHASYSHLTSDTLYLSDTKSEVKSFLLEVGEDYLTNRFRYYCQRLGYEGMQLKFGVYSSQWGSCKPKDRRVSLSLTLLFTNPAFMDAVIVHELCHMMHLNHSKAFYQEVLSWYPNYKDVMRQAKHFLLPTMPQ